MATRFAAEKGVEVLLDALPIVLERYPRAKVLFAGQYQDVMGEDAYFRRLYPDIQAYQSQGQWKFLGVLDPPQMAAFYPNLSVLLVPSLNSTETFGLVQIEAMMNGVPTVASDLPGVRQPAQMTGMGEVVPIGDAASLGAAMLSIFDHPERYRGNPKEVRKVFNPQTNAAAYDNLYQELMELLGK
jgi:glycosyltransferase involved in cell wall biosynthesis